MLIRAKKGFTLVELLIGLTLGVVVLTGLMAFFFRTSKMINIEQTQVKDLSQLQFVINKIADDLKRANTTLPEVGSSITQSFWSSLPHLPYGRTYSSVITSPADSLYRISPYYPLAYNFDSQAGLSGLSGGWTPVPTGEESNRLVFYIASAQDKKRLNDTKTKVNRVMYYLEQNTIKRREQENIQSNSTDFNSSSLPTSNDDILTNVQALQFTYPTLEYSLTSSSFQSQLNSLPNTDKLHNQNVLMNDFRNSIKVRIITIGAKISKNKTADGFDLSTEVKIRN